MASERRYSIQALNMWSDDRLLNKNNYNGNNNPYGGGGNAYQPPPVAYGQLDPR